MIELDIRHYKKIIVIGNNGSGKSYLSKKLSKALALPLIHLDLEYWQPKWVPTPRNEWLQKQVEFTSGDKWIIDGTHSSVLEERFKRTELVIFLDVSRVTCLAGVFKRMKKKRSDMPKHLEDRFDLEFLKFIIRMWNFSKERKPIILDLHNKYNQTPFLVLNNRQEIDDFLKELY